MRIRELRATDGPRIIEFLQQYFPEEEALLGTRPEGVERLLRRLFRWDARCVLGLLRLVGRPVFSFLVVEEDGRLVGSTVLSYTGPTGFISLVAVDAAHRRRGYARALLERARAVAGRRGRSYVALDVLAQNAPAIALYEAIGYRRLRTIGLWAHDSAAAFAGPPGATRPAIRPFRPADAERLVGLARQRAPPDVERVLPVRRGDLVGSALVARTMETETAGWVIDRGHGAEAWVSASVSPLTEAAHVASPIVGPHVEPELALALVRTAGRWCADRRSGRLLASVPEENAPGRAALEGGGFHEALTAYTLYRSTA
ncbi:MAG TPA: GNAT family N-acetyltransferase [Thermoplasmata archaeon]|nr:GNAT family N-acetyltransferase [Thermoplasmata archaeon]